MNFSIKSWPKFGPVMEPDLGAKQMDPQAEDPLQAAINSMRGTTSTPPQPQETADPLAGAISAFRQRPPQETPAIRELREKLADLRETFEGTSDLAGLSVPRLAEMVDSLEYQIRKVERLIRDLDGQGTGIIVIRIRTQAIDLRDAMRVKLYDALALLTGETDSSSQIRRGRRQLERFPLSDEQKAGLNALLDRREAELTAGAQPDQPEPEAESGFEGSSSEGVVLFINRDEELENAAAAALQTEWMKIDDSGRLFMENVFQTFVNCGGDGERAAVDALAEAQSTAEASVEAAGIAYAHIPPQRLEDMGIVVPTTQNIIEVPQNVEICDGHGTLSGGVSTVSVYTGELEDAERPVNMEAFQEAILNALGEGLEQLVFDMKAAGYINATDSLVADLQLYIGDDGRIRTVVATYDEPSEDVRQMYQDFAQHMAHDISRQVMAPLYMQYYKARVQFTFIESNRIFVNIVN